MSDPTTSDTKAYVFDAYGTLFDVHSAAGRLSSEIGPEASRLSQIWRDKQLQYTWIRALTGRHRDFEAVTSDALDFAAAVVGGIAPELKSKLMSAYMKLDAYEEVKGVLTELRSRGAKLAILSNGSPVMLEAGVNSSGIGDLLDANLSVEEGGVFKPAPAVYQLAVDSLGIAAQGISFQSSNRWDIAGAKAFGFRTNWINRFDQPDEFPDMPADRVLSSLLPLLEG